MLIKIGVTQKITEQNVVDLFLSAFVFSALFYFFFSLSVKTDIGPSASRIRGEDKQRESTNKPSTSKAAGINASSRAIKRSPAKPKVANAVVIAAQNARNPVQDYKNKTQERAQRNQAVQKAAEQFTPKNTRVKPAPPPRDPERTIIELTHKSHKPISSEEQLKDQRALNELYEKLDNIVSKYGPQPPPIDPKLREKLMSRVVIVNNDTQATSSAQSQPPEIVHDATQAISSSSDSSSDSSSSSDSESDKDVLKVTEPISLPANEQPAKSNPSTSLDPVVSRELDAFLDYSKLKVPRNWLPTESEEEASQKQIALTDWANDLSDSSPEQSPVVNQHYERHQQSITQAPSQNQVHTSITERQIAISTSVPTQEVTKATERAARNARIEELTRELCEIKAEFDHLQHLHQVAVNLQQSQSVAVPAINIRIDNAERRRYKRDFSEHERREYLNEVNSRPMSRGAARRLKQRIYKRRQ